MSGSVWSYSIAGGLLQCDTMIMGVGYSGRRPFLNDPASTAKQGQGPIPLGHWRMGQPYNHPNLGPCSIPLYPVTYTGTRSAFFIHGDNSQGNQSASRGCIVMNRPSRDRLAQSIKAGNTVLLVVP